MPQIVEGLEYKQIYWVRGKTPRGAMLMNDVTDPPCSGWQGAFIIPGEKRSVIFCPFTLTSYQVTNCSLEIAGAIERDEEFDRDGQVKRILYRWAEHQKRGWQSDFDTAAVVLKKLGAEVPTIVVDKDGNEDTKKRGGKEVGESLKKTVKASTKRGKFLKLILDNEGTMSVRAIMAELDMTRSSALSYLHALNKDHGIGYILVGDAATIQLPDGCDSPFDEVTHSEAYEETKKLEELCVLEDDDDDSWLD